MIRRARKSDFVSVFGLMSACVVPAWSAAAAQAAMDNAGNDWFVGEDGGAIVAYVCVENVLDEGCISSVAVAPSHRRRGIAKKLITAALASSRMNSVYLEVNENNVPAIKLYESCGFYKIGERKKYYGDCGAVLMRKELPTET